MGDKQKTIPEFSGIQCIQVYDRVELADLEKFNRKLRKLGKLIKKEGHKLDCIKTYNGSYIDSMCGSNTICKDIKIPEFESFSLSIGYYSYKLHYIIVEYTFNMVTDKIIEDCNKHTSEYRQLDNGNSTLEYFRNRHNLITNRLIMTDALVYIIHRCMHRHFYTKSSYANQDCNLRLIIYYNATKKQIKEVVKGRYCFVTKNEDTCIISRNNPFHKPLIIISNKTGIKNYKSLYDVNTHYRYLLRELDMATLEEKIINKYIRNSFTIKEEDLIWLKKEIYSLDFILNMPDNKKFEYEDCEVIDTLNKMTLKELSIDHVKDYKNKCEDLLNNISYISTAQDMKYTRILACWSAIIAIESAIAFLGNTTLNIVVVIAAIVLFPNLVVTPFIDYFKGIPDKINFYISIKFMQIEKLKLVVLNLPYTVKYYLNKILKSLKISIRSK